MAKTVRISNGWTYRAQSLCGTSHGRFMDDQNFKN